MNKSKSLRAPTAAKAGTKPSAKGKPQGKEPAKKKAVDDESLFAAFAQAAAAKGYARISMREIAKHAGLDDPSLRKRFATKAALLSAYFSSKAAQVEADLLRIKGFGEYNLVDKLQTLLESEIRILEKDREFLKGLPKLPMLLPKPFGAEDHPLKEYYLETALRFVDEAVEAKETRAPIFRRGLEEVLWLHHNAVLSFWLADKSDRHDATSELVDKSLNLLVSLLESPILRHAKDLMQFLFRTQIKDNLSVLATAYQALDLAGKFRKGRTDEKKG